MTVRKKKSTDFNILAASIVKEATGEPLPEKNPAAVALGRKGREGQSKDAIRKEAQGYSRKSC